MREGVVGFNHKSHRCIRESVVGINHRLFRWIRVGVVGFNHKLLRWMMNDVVALNLKSKNAISIWDWLKFPTESSSCPVCEIFGFKVF